MTESFDHRRASTSRLSPRCASRTLLLHGGLARAAGFRTFRFGRPFLAGLAFQLLAFYLVLDFASIHGLEIIRSLPRVEYQQFSLER